MTDGSDTRPASSEPAVRLELPARFVLLVTDVVDQLLAAHEDVLGAADHPTGPDDLGLGVAEPHPATGAERPAQPPELPDDPMWARLYPAASTDEDVDRDVSGLVRPEVIRQRREELVALREVLTPSSGTGSAPDTTGPPWPDDPVVIDLDDEAAAVVLRATHGLTIALASRANPGIFTEPGAGLPAPDPDTPAGMLSLVTEYLQMVHMEVLAQLGAT
jgi:hypothetical protein